MSKVVTKLEYRHASLDNGLILGEWELGLVERRVIFLVLSEVDSSKELDSRKWYNLDIKNYAEMCEIKDVKNAYQIVKEGISTLYDRSIEIPVNQAKTHKRKFRWIQGLEYDEVNHIVKLKWSDDIIPYISELQKNFTRYRTTTALSIKGKYAFKLYMLLESERYRGCGGEIRLNLDTIYKSWDVPAGFREFKYFNNAILKKAIAELEKLEILEVHSIKFIKSERKVIGLVIKYTLNILKKREYVKVIE